MISLNQAHTDIATRCSGVGVWSDPQFQYSGLFCHEFLIWTWGGPV